LRVKTEQIAGVPHRSLLHIVVNYTPSKKPARLRQRSTARPPTHTHESGMSAEIAELVKQETPLPRTRDDVFYFKANMGEGCNWASNFSHLHGCKINVPGIGEFPTIEHALQAMSKVHKDDIHLFCNGGCMDDFDKFVRSCAELKVQIPKLPSHRLLGWIAKIAVQPNRMRALGIRPRTHKMSQKRQIELLDFLIRIKFSPKNFELMWKLLDTCDKYIVEMGGFRGMSPWEGKVVFEKKRRTANSRDVVLHIEGENITGKLLMKRRNQLWDKIRSCK
jgi:predicted NAD-dependent protein-ADP-ribosyltransferase YbiA (DUF1768 family)